jgi:folate-binding Fe-S cluster repair protein YgfZ
MLKNDVYPQKGDYIEVAKNKHWTYIWYGSILKRRRVKKITLILNKKDYVEFAKNKCWTCI